MFICPVDKQEFSGPCTVHKCWANGTIKHESRCARICLNDKDKITAHDLAYLTDTKPRIIEKQLEEGRKKIKSWLQIFEKISSQGAPVKKHYCPACFIQKPSSGPCLNFDKCLQRQYRIQKFLHNPIIKERFPEIQAQVAYKVGELSLPILKSVKLSYLRRLSKQQAQLETSK